MGRPIRKAAKGGSFSEDRRSALYEEPDVRSMFHLGRYLGCALASVLANPIRHSYPDDPERLATALSEAPELVRGRSFIGEVEYRYGRELVKHAKEIREKLKASQESTEVARTMLLKRKPFAYEKEVRVIHLTRPAARKRWQFVFFDRSPQSDSDHSDRPTCARLPLQGAKALLRARRKIQRQHRSVRHLQDALTKR